MENLLVLLFAFFIIGAFIKVSVDTWNLIWKFNWDLKPCSMLTSFVFSIALICSYNQGILTTMGIPIEGVTYQPYFHYVDVGITSILVSGGARSVHKLTEAFKEYLVGKIQSTPSNARRN